MLLTKGSERYVYYYGRIGNVPSAFVLTSNSRTKQNNDNDNNNSRPTTLCVVRTIFAFKKMSREKRFWIWAVFIGDVYKINVLIILLHSTMYSSEHYIIYVYLIDFTVGT